MKRQPLDTAALRARGMDVQERGVRLEALAPSEKRASKRELLPTYRVGPLAWQIGVEVVPEMNLRSHQSRIARGAAQKRAVMQAVAPDWRLWGPTGDHCRAGKPLLVRFVRLGGKRLDTINLMTCFKSCEDAMASLLGCNDGSTFWRLECEQETVAGIGIRVELEMKW